MTWSSSGGVASWPVYRPPGSNLTLRANTDAGVVFVAGDYFSGSVSGPWSFTNADPAVVPAAFRPLATVTLAASSGGGTLTITPAGGVSTNSPATNTSYAWRVFYFTTVIPA